MNSKRRPDVCGWTPHGCRPRVALRRMLAAANVVAAVCLSATGDGAEGRDASRPIEMDPVEVRAAREYRAIEPGWVRADVSGFTVYARDPVGGRRVADTLVNVRTALSIVWSNPRQLALPFKVVVCDAESDFFEWTGMSLRDRDRSARKIATPVGPILVVNDIDFVQQAVGRVYVLALLEESGLPAWLREGIAQIAQSVEVNKDRVKVGVVKLNEPELVSAPRLQQLLDIARAIISQDVAELTRLGLIDPNADPDQIQADLVSGGSALLLRHNIAINGQSITGMQLEDYCQTELRRRLDAREQHLPETEFFSFFTTEPPLPLSRVFDPKTPDTVEWRMTAWAFVHLALFGENQRYRPAFLKFVQALEQETRRGPDEIFAECFGTTSKKFMPTLAGYARRGSYRAPEYRLGGDVTPTPPQFVDAPEAELIAAKARVLSARGENAPAYALLDRGYDNPVNRTAAYVTALAELAPATAAARTLERLHLAMKNEALDVRGYRVLGKVRLAAGLGNDERLDGAETEGILQALETAVQKGDRSEEVFVLLGRTWMSAPSRRAHPAQVETMQIAQQRFPQSAVIAELVEALKRKS